MLVAMSMHGTAAYRPHTGSLPPLVERALSAARRHGFGHSCRPEQGRLLHLLAGGARRSIAETGTGCGVGLAWLASGAAADVQLLSVERDPARAKVAADVFAAKGGGAADPERLLEPGGVLVVDDFTPSRSWPPTYAGRTDTARLHWLEHPALRTVDLPLAADLSALVAVRRTDL